MTRLVFNELKAAQAAGFLLQLWGGTEHILRLIKELYFADREALIRWGRPITTDCYVSMPHGPVVSRIYNLICDDEREGGPWSSLISEQSGKQVSLKGDLSTSELSRAEEALLREIHEKYKNLTRWQLRDLSHELPEWVDPKGSSIRIEYRDILKAAGKTEAETELIEQELEALQEADRFLSAHSY